MDAAISEPLVEVLLPPGRLDAFLDALVAQGLVIDVEQRVRLNSLLLCLAAERRLPDDPDALCRLITPVLSGSAAEQMVCETTFKTVFIGSVPTQPSAFRLTSDEGIKDHYARGNSWTAKAWLARGAMSATTALVIAAVVYLAIAYGVFWRNDFREAKPVEPTFGTIVRVDFEWLNNYPIEELAVPRQSPWNRTWRWFYTEYTPVKWTALLLPWIMCLGFLAWLYHRMLAYLRREGLKQNLRSLDLRFGNVKARFGDRKLIGALQPLRGLARTYLHVLDHDRTAVASAKAAGQFKPQFIEVAVPTDFVVLIDRRSPADHLADYNMEVVRTLRDAGLSVEILEFNNEPTLCHFQHMGEFLRLDAVVRRFPDSIILIFATAEQLIDPARQRLLPAVLALKSARRAILLTPDSGGAETPLERQICRRLGTTILRTTPAGVGELVSLLLGISGSTWRRPNSSGGNRMGVGPLLDLMTARPERWMQKVGPPRRERRHLRELLRGALDAPALRWLTATTVYPELRWPLTLSLKSAVSSSYGERYALDADLLLVSQLSWFRSGWMPDWTRSLLQQTLNEDEKKRVRRVILEAIGLGNQRPGRSDQGLQITFVDERARPAHRVKADSIMLDYLLPALQSSHRGGLPKSGCGALQGRRRPRF